MKIMLSCDMAVAWPSMLQELTILRLLSYRSPTALLPFCATGVASFSALQSKLRSEFVAQGSRARSSMLALAKANWGGGEGRTPS